MNELSQLDELIESDVLEALGQESSQNTIETEIETPPDQEDQDEILIEDFHDPVEIEEETTQTEENLEENEQEEETQDTTQIVSELNTDDLASLLKQLLTNKTIEITIKIKD